MQAIDLKVSYLKAAAVVMAKQDIRYYLNGVMIDVLPRAVRIVSTDGHRLVCFHSELAIEEGAADMVPAQIIIPGEVLKGLKARHRNLQFLSLQFNEAAPLEPCTLSGCDGADKIFKPVDAKYPDYMRVLPNSRPTGEKAHFNPHYVADMAEVVRIAMDRKSGDAKCFPSVYHNGNGCAPVMYDGLPEFYGALMSMRWVDTEWECPKWINPAPIAKVA